MLICCVRSTLCSLDVPGNAAVGRCQSLSGIPDKDIDTLSHLTIYKTLLTTHY
nr:MAG TPA: hypothetical protein [Bacteriophage sp.]